jgi:hypothetical protein
MEELLNEKLRTFGSNFLREGGFEAAGKSVPFFVYARRFLNRRWQPAKQIPSAQAGAGIAGLQPCPSKR